MMQEQPMTAIMPEIKRILVPTDFSPGAGAALDWANRMAQCFNAELLLVHALDLSLGAAAGLPSDLAMMPAVQQLADRIREEAETEMARLAERYPQARRIIREGIPRQVILQVAKEEGASIIVMGTHGRTGLAHVFFGSVAEHVVRHSRVPVLTVRYTEAAAASGTGAQAAE
jgi:nucleotide-binding universal stress UspA family protein